MQVKNVYFFNDVEYTSIAPWFENNIAKLRLIQPQYATPAPAVSATAATAVPTPAGLPGCSSRYIM